MLVRLVCIFLVLQACLARAEEAGTKETRSPRGWQASLEASEKLLNKVKETAPKISAGVSASVSSILSQEDLRSWAALRTKPGAKLKQTEPAVEQSTAQTTDELLTERPKHGDDSQQSMKGGFAADQLLLPAMALVLITLMAGYRLGQLTNDVQPNTEERAGANALHTPPPRSYLTADNYIDDERPDQKGWTSATVEKLPAKSNEEDPFLQDRYIKAIEEMDEPVNVGQGIPPGPKQLDVWQLFKDFKTQKEAGRESKQQQAHSGRVPRKDADFEENLTVGESVSDLVASPDIPEEQDRQSRGAQIQEGATASVAPQPSQQSKAHGSCSATTTAEQAAHMQGPAGQRAGVLEVQASASALGRQSEGKQRSSKDQEQKSSLPISLLAHEERAGERGGRPEVSTSCSVAQPEARGGDKSAGRSPGWLQAGRDSTGLQAVDDVGAVMEALVSRLNLDTDQMAPQERMQLLQMALQCCQHRESSWLFAHANELRQSQAEAATGMLAHKRQQADSKEARRKVEELSTALQDGLLSGLVLMMVITIFCGVKCGYLGRKLGRCPTLASLSAPSFWRPWASLDYLGVLWCWALASSEALLGCGIILCVAYAAVRGGVYHGTTFQAPLLKLGIGLGLICGLAGYIAIGKMGGEANRWLCCWETWVTLHLTAAWQLPTLQASLCSGRWKGLKKFLYHTSLSLLFPLAIATAPFEGCAHSLLSLRAGFADLLAR